MADTNLSIVLKLVDEATAALSGVSEKTRKSLEDIKGSAETVAVSFGVMGAAVTGVLGEMAKQAADSALADMQMNTAIRAAIQTANDDAAATGLLTKQKQLLQSQLDGVTARIADYQSKIDAGKDSTGSMASAVDILQQKVTGLREKLSTLDNEQSLVGANAGEIARQFTKLADANTSLGFQNDETVKSLTTLFRATGSVSEAIAANNEAMDLARAKSIDLNEAAILVVQAMEGNGRALKQFGINLKDGLTPAEALAALQQKLAGSAQDYVNTSWGQLDVAKAKTGLLAETMGAQLLPVLNNVLQALIPLVDRFTAFADAHPQLVSNMLLAIGAFGVLSLAVSAVAGAIAALSSVIEAAVAADKLMNDAILLTQGTMSGFMVAAGPWLIVLAAIAAAVYLVANAFGAMQDAASGAIGAASQLSAESNKLTPLINNATGPNKARLQALQSSAQQTAATTAAIGQRYTGISGGLNAVTDFLGFTNAPQFENGGIVPGMPGQAVPIIAHAGERVIPAKQANQSGVTNIVFNFSGPVAGDDGIKKIITDTIRTLNRQSTLQFAGL